MKILVVQMKILVVQILDTSININHISDIYDNNGNENNDNNINKSNNDDIHNENNITMTIIVKKVKWQWYKNNNNDNGNYNENDKGKNSIDSNDRYKDNNNNKGSDNNSHIVMMSLSIKNDHSVHRPNTRDRTAGITHYNGKANDASLCNERWGGTASLYYSPLHNYPQTTGKGKRNLNKLQFH